MRGVAMACGGLLLVMASGLAGAQPRRPLGLVRLAGDGRLGAIADGHRGVSSAWGWEGTPASVIPRMIELASVGPDDVVYEPGCGDARIVIAAVHAGARRGVGVDIDPDLAEVCYARVVEAGLADRIAIYWGDALGLDMSDVTVVFLFMGSAFNKVMRPLLWEQLPVGARVVSNDFPMGDWQPDRTVEVETPGRTYLLYLWTITPEIKARSQPDGATPISGP